MSHIILLGFASAGSLTVQLLAVVLVIMTRPNPEPLLWAFWLSAMVVSCGVSGIVLAVFRAKGTFLGTTSKTVSPTIYLVVGAIALAVAIFAATRRGRELIGREMDKRQSSGGPDAHGSIGDRAQAKVQEVKVKAQEALKRGSVWVAIGAGVFLGAPSPHSLAAAGLMVRDGYRLPTQLLLGPAFVPKPCAGPGLGDVLELWPVFAVVRRPRSAMPWTSRDERHNGAPDGQLGTNHLQGPGHSH